jgi:hypothetical protein
VLIHAQQLAINIIILLAEKGIRAPKLGWRAGKSYGSTIKSGITKNRAGNLDKESSVPISAKNLEQNGRIMAKT